MDDLELWQRSLSEMELSMTKSTYKTWLSGTKPLARGNGRLTIGVHNDYAVDWLSNRLHDTILRIVSGLDDSVTAIDFCVHQNGNGPPPAPARPKNMSDLLHQASFPGFESYQTNFVQVPKQFFEVVLVDGPYVMRVFIGCVIAQTYGVVVNLRTHARREWWEASRREIQRITGIGSLASVDNAIRESRARGFVVRGDGRKHYKYRPREAAEPVDYPD